MNTLNKHTFFSVGKATIFRLLLSPLFFIFSLITVSVLVSCESAKPPIADAVNLRDSVPIMTTYGVSKLISDSGVIRYKIVAEEWKVYDRTNPPKQTFMQGLLLQQFDEKFHIQMYITADTAYWYNEYLWELRGRVCLWNAEGTVFQSELLYWDMNRHEFYSNVYSHLVSPIREVSGSSFHSNEQMTRYEVNITQAAFPIPQHEGETTSTDTTAVADSLAIAEPLHPSISPQRKNGNKGKTKRMDGSYR